MAWPPPPADAPISSGPGGLDDPLSGAPVTAGRVGLQPACNRCRGRLVAWAEVEHLGGTLGLVVDTRHLVGPVVHEG
jgi:hypothetical protein